MFGGAPSVRAATEDHRDLPGDLVSGHPDRFIYHPDRFIYHPDRFIYHPDRFIYMDITLCYAA